MLTDIVVIFESGREEEIGSYASYVDAVYVALRLTDQFGFDLGDGSERAQWVELRHFDQVELTLRVIRGGLLGMS
jgi:hypothetical protein